MSALPRGIGVSPGAAVGPVVQVRPPVRPPDDEPAPADPAAEHVRIKAAFESVAVTLEERAAAAEETAQQILTATALIARDKGLQKAIAKHLAAGKGPTTAVTAAVQEYAAQFAALGGYFAERVTDLKDVRDRAAALTASSTPPMLASNATGCPSRVRPGPADPASALRRRSRLPTSSRW